MSDTKPRGGAREGAGRPRGAVTPDKLKIRSVPFCLHDVDKARVEKLRGDKPRGKWLMDMLNDIQK